MRNNWSKKGFSKSTHYCKRAHSTQGAVSLLCNNHGKSNNPYPSIPRPCPLTRAGLGPSSRNLGKGRVDIIWSCPLPTKSTITQPTEKKSKYFNTLLFPCHDLSLCHIQPMRQFGNPTLIPFSLTISVDFSLDYISNHFDIQWVQTSASADIWWHLMTSDDTCWHLMTRWHVSGRRCGRSHGWHHGHLWWTQVRLLMVTKLQCWCASFSGPPLVFPSCTVALTLDTASCSWWSTLLTLYTTVAVILVVISLLG